ncbi:LysR family transcriptional regulator ArgP [Oceanobacter sp. 5_MG-2023]|uniref:LysR family transcriptional regulator ArgP n=1 Tax=Oceanobacter sp. 5_MG-2023 TaxID=3062645 RepID=UPI0026E14527|nr:LysR family transcriptional regulator ArgP [Oceanobacter sp. 5_MG-2023]MDO6681675.1 LysR family transcriptional regulator ArgP [Oceanobacter sp. 5_MG-2023]
MIDYRALEALVAVIETRGFERAAQRLNISQSAVSQRIRQLEFKLGQPVLLRTTPPKPTELGQRLANHRQQVQQLEQGLLLDEGDQGQAVRIRLAVNADSLDTWLVPALAAAPDSHSMDFELLVDDQDVGLRRMKNGEVMACICAADTPVNGGLLQSLGILRYRAFASPDFVARHGAGQPLLMPQPPLAQLPCLIFNQDDRLQHRFLQALCPQQPEPQRYHISPTSEGFVRMALEGLGYGMMPQLQVARYLEDGTLVDVVPGYYLDVVLYWHYWQTESPVMRGLREAVVAAARDCLIPLSPPLGKGRE